MSRRKKIEVVAQALRDNHMGQPLSEHEVRWLSAVIVDALKKRKLRR